MELFSKDNLVTLVKNNPEKFPRQWYWTKSRGGPNDIYVIQVWNGETQVNGTTTYNLGDWTTAREDANYLKTLCVEK